MKKLLPFALAILSTPVIAENIDVLTGQVKAVQVQYWREDTACIQVEDRWFKLDLDTTKGQSLLSLALAASAAKQQVQVRWFTERPLLGGCDTGTSMNPLYSFRVL